MSQQKNVPEASSSKSLRIVKRNAGFRMDGYWVWCPSVIKGDDGRYHMFASRWPKNIIFHPGWMTDSEVVRAVSDTPEGPYEFQEVVLPARGAQYWDGRSTHNPRITRWRDQYVLFYTGITHPFPDTRPGDGLCNSDPRCVVSRSNKRVGIATAKSALGPWKRFDAPILPTKPETFYSFLTSNPAAVVGPDDHILLFFKSRQYVGQVHSDMMIGLASADTPMGPYRVLTDRPLFSKENLGEIEDPFVWYQNHAYHMIAKDMHGTLCGEYHGGIHAVSEDGKKWIPAANPLAYSRTIQWDDGTIQTLGSMERPSLLIENGRPTHFFAAVADGPGGFSAASSTWNIAVRIDDFMV